MTEAQILVLTEKNRAHVQVIRAWVAYVKKLVAQRWR